jgi:enoyl-CoA hydratase/carnithine racemase
MTTIDSSRSQNGRGSDEWSRSWTHVRVDRRNLGYCRVTFDHPPINAITGTMVSELSEIVELIEQDRDLNVVVFDSANPAFYLATYGADDDGPTAMRAWMEVLVRLSRAAVVSIAEIRGRAAGAGAEFALACDLRFASREKTLLGRFVVGAGMVPASGPLVIFLVTDDELDAEVDAVASRLARADREAITGAKAHQAAPPAD